MTDELNSHENRQSTKKPDQVKRWVRIMGTVITGGLFLWLLSRQNWQEIGNALSHLPVWLWLAVFGIHIFHAVLNTLRWYVLLKAQSVRMTFSEANHLAFAGLFASNFLPTTIGGDLLRVAGMRKYDPGLSIGLASIIVDRLINIIGTLFYLPFTVAVFLPILRRGELDFTVSALFAGFQQKIRQWLKKFGQALQLWMKQPRTIIMAFTVSISADLVLLFSQWLLARGMGIQVTFMEVTAIRTFAYFVMMLPISINGYGLREIGITTLYIALGTDPAQAVAFALITRLFLVLRTLPGGLWLSTAMSALRSNNPET